MQPVKVTIVGDFWDVQIYRGRLYLWDVNGRVAVYDWDALVDSIAQKLPSRLPVTLALARGDVLYQGDPILTTSPEFRGWLEQLMADLTREGFSLERERLREFLLGEQDSPYKHLPADTEIYWNTLYGIDDQGLWSASIHRSWLKYPISSRPQRVWSAPIYSVSAYGGRLALAAGDEGLFEYDLDPHRSWLASLPSQQADAPEVVQSNLLRLSHRHCSEAAWAFSSIYGASNVSGGYLVAFDWLREPRPAHFLEEDEEEPLVRGGGRPFKLRFVRTFEQKDIIPPNGIEKFSWAGQDKIYAARNGSLDVVRFTQRNLTEPDLSAFEHLSTVQLSDMEQIVAGGVAHFGTILETQDRLLVMLSDNQTFEIKGPLTRWRLYPRATRYENHLHVILDDRLEIYSFNNDYAVRQQEKLFGMKYSPPGRSRRR